jgi:hypothetical protein
MSRSRTWLRTWVAIISIAIVAMPVNAHLHLCFDGSEAPSSVHLIDDGMHHGEEAAGLDHQDIDLNIDSSALAKKFDGPKQLPALALALVLFTVSLQDAVASPRDDTSRFVPSPDHRKLPPARAPPV